MVVVTARIPALPPTPTESVHNDFNGDGEIDVSDAVHLLVYLFRGGEPPAAIAASSPIVDENIAEIADQLAILNDKLDVRLGKLCHNLLRGVSLLHD